jgi:putative ABC transport system ATP-binding protein
MKMLQANEVSKVFRRGSHLVSAVENVTLNLPPGQVTAVIGRSGSGKSTLLNLLAGLLTPTSGTVTLDEQKLYGRPDLELSQLRNRKIGIIPQGQAAIQSLTVRQNILLPLGFFPEAPAPDRAAELMELVGIPHLADAKPATLSGGELRRMAIARAMIQRPEVILADEPTSDLDEENTNAVTALLRQAADQGAAVLLVTHEMDTLQIADTVYRMEHGVLKNSA